MDRSLRRHQQKVARVRKLRTLWNYWEGYFEPERYKWSRARIWQPMHKLTMNGYPKAWDTIMHIRPARIRSAQLCRLIELGREDVDPVDFPDYRKPHIYYW
jgi:hypothetical protein